MTPSALGILVLINLVAGEDTVGLVERQLLVILSILAGTNKSASECTHISSSKSTNLLPQDFKHSVRLGRNSDDQREPELTCQNVPKKKQSSSNGWEKHHQCLGRHIHLTWISAPYHLQAFITTLTLSTYAQKDANHGSGVACEGPDA
jgi:hypothetical protein